MQPYLFPTSGTTGIFQPRTTPVYSQLTQHKAGYQGGYYNTPLSANGQWFNPYQPPAALRTGNNLKYVGDGTYTDGDFEYEFEDGQWKRDDYDLGDRLEAKAYQWTHPNQPDVTYNLEGEKPDKNYVPRKKPSFTQPSVRKVDASASPSVSTTAPQTIQFAGRQVAVSQPINPPHLKIPDPGSRLDLTG